MEIPLVKLCYSLCFKFPSSSKDSDTITVYTRKQGDNKSFPFGV